MIALTPANKEWLVDQQRLVPGHWLHIICHLVFNATAIFTSSLRHG
jgi:hypothetical protein